MNPLQIGVCTWSLGAPDLPSALQLAHRKLGVRLVQLGFFEPAHFEQLDQIEAVLPDADLEISATCLGHPGEDYTTIASIARTGGYRPDTLWPERWAATLCARDATARLSVALMATHVGRVPENAGSTEYANLRQRVQQVADALDEKQITLAMETGPEPAERLAQFMADVNRPNVKINFDPANLILYGVGEPVAAIEVLRQHVAHVHMKDAVWSAKPGVDWGQEVPLGEGDADIPRVVSRLRAIGYAGPLVVEREAGAQRLRDIQEALDLLESLLN
jgi:L-ribulose-5-phosphate 3-epimerase